MFQMSFAKLIIWCCTFLAFILRSTDCGNISSANAPPFCRYKKCPATKAGVINLHLISHTHMDAGWVSTVDEYYDQYVNEIITSVVKNLDESSSRRFVFVETCFFARWWKSQNEATKQKVRQLVNKGIFEWLSGGWVMNDEAVPNYQQIVDQMTLGHRWLNRTFKDCGQPKIGWQIDPFGHSKQYATTLADMGFDALFLGRIDYQDKLQREQTKTLEFMWKTSESLGLDANLFTVVLPNVYWPPNGFCWDMTCGDAEMSDENAVNKAKFIISLAKEQSKKYKTNNTLITMGNDFTHRDASKWFRNLDKLIDAINNLTNEGIHAFHSTTSCYLNALHNTAEEWPIMKGDDFFPYADKYNAYWSGYYTSRPTLKYLVFYVNTYLQAAKQLSVLANLNQTLVEKLVGLQESMGILAHHDAIAGTEKQHVAEDYKRMLCSDLRHGETVIEQAVNRLLHQGNDSAPVLFCHNLNISECNATENLTENSQVVVTAYNSLAHTVNTYIKLPVQSESSFKVTYMNGSDIPSQVVPNHPCVNNLPGRVSSSNSTLIFPAILSPLGIESFVISRKKENASAIETHQSNNDNSISNENFTISINKKTGVLKTITLKNNKILTISQKFSSYEAEGILSPDKPSGAYAFNPVFVNAAKIANKVQFKILKGPLVEEVHQNFSSWVSQVIRVYKNQSYIEFDWTVGPIPVDDMTDEGGLEIITQFCSDIQSNATFYTDSNGKENLRRVRHERRSWNLSTSEKVASNYYPITNNIFIKNEQQNLQLSVIPDRPQGGSSMIDGCVQLMVHRRLLHDDGYGVVEPLNEKGIDKRGLIVRGRHWLILDDIENSVVKLKKIRKIVQNEPILMFRKENRTKKILNTTKAFSGLKSKLPQNVNVLSLEHWDDERILLRLEHLFEQNEHSKYSGAQNVSISKLFEPFTVVEAIEMSLNAVHEKKSLQENKLKWNVSKSEPSFYRPYKSIINDTQPKSLGSDLDSSLSFNISAMQIRTFLIKVKFENESSKQPKD